MKKDPNVYPVGWNAKTIGELAEHFDRQSDEEAIAEDEAALGSGDSTFMEIPHDLVPAVRDLIAKHQDRS